MTDESLSLFEEHSRVVFENEVYQFLTTDLTRKCTKNARKMDVKGIELRGWTVYKVINKSSDNHEEFYVIYDDKNTPFHDTRTIWEMFDWVEIKKYMLSFDYDIVDMAERLREDKKGKQ